MSTSKIRVIIYSNSKDNPTTKSNPYLSTYFEHGGIFSFSDFSEAIFRVAAKRVESGTAYWKAEWYRNRNEAGWTECIEPHTRCQCGDRFKLLGGTGEVFVIFESVIKK